MDGTNATPLRPRVLALLPGVPLPANTGGALRALESRDVLFGRQQEALATFQEQNEKLYDASYRAQFISGIIQPAMNFISNLNYVAIAVIGGVQVANGTMSLGDVQAFIQYSRQFTQPLTQIASMANVLQSGSVLAAGHDSFECVVVEQSDELTALPGDDLCARAGATARADRRAGRSR